MAILKNLIVNGVARVIGDLTASKIIKQGGVSSLFLKADGSIDSTSYYHSGNKPSLSDLGAANKEHTHTFASLTSKPTTIEGYGITNALISKYITTKNDYELYVILLCKIGTNTTNTQHKINGTFWTTYGGYNRYQSAYINVHCSDWSSGHNEYYGFTPFGLGTKCRLVTCTYQSNQYLAITHENHQACEILFDGSYLNILFTPILYYTSNTGVINNSEIYNSISEVTPHKLAFTTDNVVSASKWSIARTIALTGSVTGSVSIDGSGDVTLVTTTNHTHSYLPLSGGTLTGTLTTSNVVLGGALSFKPLITATDLNNITTGLYHTSTDSNTIDNITNRAFDSSFALISAEMYNSGTDIRRAQLAMDGCGNAKIRGSRTSGYPWYTLLHSENYNSYSPKLDGTGASGTWKINISGDANTLDGYHYSDIILSNGKNLIRNYDIETTSSSYLVWSPHIMTETVANGEQVTITIEYSISSDSTKTWLYMYTGGGYASIASFDATPGLNHHTQSVTTTMRYDSNHNDNSVCLFYGPTSNSGTCTVHKIKVERGNRFTGWSPAPEDLITTTNIGSQSVNYASSAGNSTTASSVDWSGITNKPSSFIPSDHTHSDTFRAKYNDNYVELSFRDTALSQKANETYIECWDGDGGWWNWKANKWIKAGSSDDYVLLGGGGHKLISDFATSGHTHSYLPLSGGTMTGSIILKGETSADMTYAGNIHPCIRFDNSDSSQNVSFIFTDYDAYRSPAGIKLVGNQGDEWFEAPNIYATTFYGDLSGNAKTATNVAWSGVTNKPNFVNSFGTKTGDITIRGGQTGNGSVNLTMSNNELLASIVGLGSNAYTSTAYLPLAGGTITGTIGKSSNYIFKPNGGDYRTTTDKHTGAICISLPANIGNAMVSMWIDVYNYSTNTSFSVHVGGYTYNNSTFAYRPFAMVYGASHKVRLTYDNGFKIYIGETDTTWNYPQISIRDVVIGHNPSYSNWCNDWSISFVTSFPTINAEISRYVLSSDNYSTLVSPKTHTHTVSINGVIKTIESTGGNAVDLGSYLPLSGGNMSGNITLYSSSVDSPHLIFQRGTDSDGAYDWDQFVTEDCLKIRYNSKGTWTEVLSLHPGNNLLEGNTILTAGNSSVSGGGSSWGSSITVKINGTSKTLTIPSNPNTDSLVKQSQTTTSNFRPLLMGYTYSSAADTTLEAEVTNQSYLSSKFYAQPSTGKLYATTFVGNLTGTASNVTVNNNNTNQNYNLLFHLDNTIYKSSGSVSVTVNPSTGNITAGHFYANSDIRYKNIIEYHYSLSDKIAQLPIIKYKWIDRDDDSIHIGSSALSVMSIIPELVSYDDNTDFYSLDYATLGAVAGISACKEVEMLKLKIKELELEIIILKSKHNG